MNKLDELGHKHGYWEERSYKTISKGTYINGNKQGKWLNHWEDHGDYITQYEDNKAIYHISWLSNNISYILNRPKTTREIHNEEYQ